MTFQHLLITSQRPTQEACPLEEGGSNYYCLLDLLSKIEQVLIENSVLVPLSAILHSHPNYYL